MVEDGPSDSSRSDDDFQRAAAAAEAEAGKPGWLMMPPSERARAIYESLRRIDAERAGSLVILPARRVRLNTNSNGSSVSHGHWAASASHSDTGASD